MEKKARNSLARKKYQKPKIIYSKEIEVLAMTCPSGYSGLPDCLTDGLCGNPWQ